MNEDDQDNVGDAEIVSRVRDILGARLTAYIASVQETRIVRAWADGTETLSPEVSQRLRLAYRIVAEIAQHEGNAITQAWFIGMNPLLDDLSPAQMTRDENPGAAAARLLGAMREFIAEG